MVERRSSEDGVMLADGLSGGASPPESFGTGRVCREPSCQVRLSRYNSTHWCALHESPGATGRPYENLAGQRGRRRNTLKNKETKVRRASAA